MDGKWKERVISFVISLTASLSAWFVVEYKGVNLMEHIKSLFTAYIPVIILLFVYCLCWLVIDYWKLRRFHKRKYETFHQWLLDHRSTGYPRMSETYLEGRIVSMLEWWDDQKKLTKKDAANR
jgi:uncharacterized membrane protein YbhN (UPF0104 family)